MAHKPLSAKEPKSPDGKKRVGGWRTFPSRIRDNPLVILAVLLGSAVIALSTFSDAAKSLFDLVRDTAAPRISGTWTTPTLTNPYEHTDHYHLSFEFKRRGHAVTGTLTHTEEDDEARSFVYPILDGNIDRETISFHTDFKIEGREDHPSSDFYVGTVMAGQISFRTWNNVGSSIKEQRFLAKRLPEPR